MLRGGGGLLKVGCIIPRLGGGEMYYTGDIGVVYGMSLWRLLGMLCD